MIIFDDAPDVDTAIAEMTMFDKNNGETRTLTTEYSRTLVANTNHLNQALGVLRASIQEPTKRQFAATLVIAQAFHKNKNRVIFELPAGHGKSYIMLLVAGLLLKKDAVKHVELIYHEQAILDAERPHIAIMRKHFGEKISANTYLEAQS